MASDSSDTGNSIGRRDFLKSMLGLGGILEVSEASAKPATGRTIFFWSDLKTGQVGFPTGFMVEAGLPGSVMKIVAAAALFEERLISPNETIDCKGHATIQGRKINCLFAHGKVDAVHAIAQSCNVYFATASKNMSQSLFLSYATKLGLDSSVGSVRSGLFPKPEKSTAWPFVLGLSPHLHPNGLQLMRLSAIVATCGDVPHLHSAEENAQGKPRLKIEFSDLTWGRLQQGMELAVREGTAHKLDPSHKLHVAAKTGTAPNGKKFQSWVTGYFPSESPRYAFCLGATSGTSSEVAVPKAKEFLFATEWP
ncbi:MAG: hypothetical protein IT342_24405 [Candidatus Melainabacteria bacterium]|nr:hypothetical protein [Candidatus Melainabacteria bacterium]